MKPDIETGILSRHGFNDLIEKASFETSQVIQNWRHRHGMTCDSGTIPSRNIGSG